MKIEVTGNLIEKSAVEVFASGFKKRTFVVESRNGNFIAEYPFELHKDDVDFVAALKKDALIHVRGFVQVNKGAEGTSYAGKRFVSLKATAVDLVGATIVKPPAAAAVPARAQQWAPEPAPSPAASDDSDDIPF